MDYGIILFIIGGFFAGLVASSLYFLYLKKRKWSFESLIENKNTSSVVYSTGDFEANKSYENQETTNFYGYKNTSVDSSNLRPAIDTWSFPYRYFNSRCFARGRGKRRRWGGGRRFRRRL